MRAVCILCTDAAFLAAVPRETGSHWARAAAWRPVARGGEPTRRRDGEAPSSLTDPLCRRPRHRVFSLFLLEKWGEGNLVSWKAAEWNPVLFWRRCTGSYPQCHADKAVPGPWVPPTQSPLAELHLPACPAPGAPSRRAPRGAQTTLPGRHRGRRNTSPRQLGAAVLRMRRRGLGCCSLTGGCGGSSPWSPTTW